MAESSPEVISSSSNNDNSSTPTDPSQNPTSPYYFHPGENLGAVLVSPPLNGTNYYHWSKAIKRTLSSKNKLKFINGVILQPSSNDPLYDSWERCNNTVVSWITPTLAPNISQSIIGMDNARDLWLNLQERFTKGNHFHMSDLLQELHSMRQGERSISTYFTDMKIIWDELDFLRPTPTCSCTIPYSCTLNYAVTPYKEKGICPLFSERIK